MNTIKKYKNYIWTGIFIIITALVFSTADLMTDEIKLFEALSLLGSDKIFAFRHFARYRYFQFPIMEEMIFREIIFSFLKRKIKYANIIQAALSAFFHFYFIKNIFEPTYRIEKNLYSDWLIIFIPSFFTGLIYGYLKEKTGKIDVAIFFHILYSFSFFYLSSFYIKISLNFMEKVSKMRLTGYNTVIYSFVFIFMIWLIVLTIMILKRRQILDKPEGKNE